MNVSDLPNHPLSPYEAFDYLARNTCAKRKVDSHYDNATTLEDFLTDNDVSAKRRKIDNDVSLVLMRIAQENEERRMKILKEAQQKKQESNKIASLDNEETSPCELVPSGEPKAPVTSSRPHLSGDAFCMLPLKKTLRNAISNPQNTQPPANNGVFSIISSGIIPYESMGTAQSSLLCSVAPLQTRSIINMPIEASKARFPPRSLEVSLPSGNCIPYMPTTESGTKK